MYVIQFLPIDSLNDELSEKFDKNNLFDPELDESWMDYASGYKSCQDVVSALIEAINSEEIDSDNCYYRVKEVND